MHALDIQVDPEYKALACKCPSWVHANTAFVQFLIDTGVMIEQPAPRVGLLGVYFDNARIRHIGRLISENRLISKWGVGHLYEHKIFEVPESYGIAMRPFSSPDRETVLEHFIAFAKTKGVLFQRNPGTDPYS